MSPTPAARRTHLRDFRLVAHGLDDATIGREARAEPDDHSAVRLWLRLLSCSTQIEQAIRARLRQRFATTLPRFDYLAQLERHPDGLRMNALSRYLMVTGGSVTGLTDQLVTDGFVERAADPTDRRSQIVRLTAGGRTRFLAMAAEHEAWLAAMLDGFEPRHRDLLYETLGRLRVHLTGVASDADAAPDVTEPQAPPSPAPTVPRDAASKTRSPDSTPGAARAASRAAGRRRPRAPLQPSERLPDKR